MKRLMAVAVLAVAVFGLTTAEGAVRSKSVTRFVRVKPSQVRTVVKSKSSVCKCGVGCPGGCGCGCE